VKALETVTRISLKNILYTTDFSPTAEAAAPYAWELAKRYGAKVIALHVRPVEANGMVPPEAWAAVHEANELQAKQQAGHLKTLFRGIENEVEVTEGAIWDEISRTIEEKEVDLLVTGTHGREGPRPARAPRRRARAAHVPRGAPPGPRPAPGPGSHDHRRRNYL